MRNTTTSPSSIALALALTSGCYTGADAGSRDPANNSPAPPESPESSESPESPAGGTTPEGILVRALDPDQDPIEGARVTFGCGCGQNRPTCSAEETLRDGRTAAPYFHPGGRFIACVEHPEHAPATVVLPDLRQNTRHEHTVILLPYGPPLTPELEGDQLVVARGGVRVSFVEDSVLDSEGEPVGHDFEVTIADLDPAAEDRRRGLWAMPGPLIADNGATLLESVRMAEISLWRGDQPLTLDPTKPATIEFEISPEHPGYDRLLPGDPLPLWSFDLGAGQWIREGEGEILELDGRRIWRAQVRHFTWWNADVPIDQKDCFNIQIVVGNENQKQGDFLGDIPITLAGINYAGASVDLTDPQGQTCLEAPETDYVDPLTVFEIYAGLQGDKLNLPRLSNDDPILNEYPAGHPNDSTACGTKTCKDVTITIKSVCTEGDSLTDWKDLPIENQQGECQPDVFECESGIWVQKQQYVGPQEEQEDDLDHNCNGVDNDVPNAFCNADLGIECHDYRPFGLCRVREWICDNNIVVCTDGVNDHTPLPEKKNNGDDEDCNGWPNDKREYLLLGGPGKQRLRSAARVNPDTIALVGTNEYNTVEALDDQNNSDLLESSPYFLALYNFQTDHPALYPISFPGYNDKQHVHRRRPITVHTDAITGNLLLAGACRGATTVIDQEVDCGEGGLFIAIADPTDPNLKVVGSPRVIPNSGILDDLSLARSTDQLVLTGSLSHGTLGTIPSIEVHDFGGQTENWDGFILRLDPGTLEDIQEPMHIDDPGYPSRQEITASQVIDDQVYFAGRKDTSLGPVVLFGRIEDKNSAVELNEDHPITDEQCLAQSITGVKGGNDQQRVAFAFQSCDSLVGKTPENTFALIVIADVPQNLADLVWAAENDVIALRSEGTSEIRMITPIAEKDLLAVGKIRTNLLSQTFPMHPLEDDGGFLVRRNPPTGGGDPWAIPIRDTIGTASADFVSLDGDLFTVAGTFSGKLDIDELSELQVTETTSQEIYVLRFPLPAMQ